MELLLPTALLVALSLAGSRLSRKAPLCKFYWPALILKIASGVALGLVYTHFYDGGDTWAYYHSGNNWVALATPWQLLGQLIGLDSIPEAVYEQHVTNNLRAMRMQWIVGAITGFMQGNYWLISALFSLFAFSGLWRLANACVRYLNAPKWAMVIAWLAYPGLVFWSSGLLKESLLLGSIGWLVSSALGWKFSAVFPYTRLDGLLQLIFAIVGIWVLWYLKYYYFAVLFVALSSWLATDAALQYPFFRKNIGYLVGGLLVVIFLSIKIGQQVYPLLSADRIVESIYDNYVLLSSDPPDPSSQIILPRMEPSCWGLLQSWPKALWEGFTRPYPWEDGHIFKLLNSSDGLIMAISLGGMLAGRRWLPSAYRMRWLCLFGAMYVFTLGSLLSIAAPNLGALARYRVGYTPFLLAYLLTMGRVFWERIYRRLANH